MAEMCSKCSMEHGFGVDIDVKAIFEGLREGFEISVLCEGCAMLSVAKTLDSKCIVFFGQFCPVVEHRSKWMYYDVENNKVLEEYKAPIDKPKTEENGGK